MNSLQFAFRVREGDFLGLLAHNWGIEFDKNKVKAILGTKTSTS